MKDKESFLDKLKKTTRIAGFDPQNFQEKWGINLTRLQLVSFILLFALIVSTLTIILVSYTPLSALLPYNGNFSSRDQIEQQYIEITKLKKSVEAQNNYIKNIQEVILGNKTIDSVMIAEPVAIEIETTTIDTARTKNELLLAQEIETGEEIDKTNEQQLSNLFILVDPVIGVISQKFDKNNHPGIDVVSKLNAPIKACAEGTVVFTGYSEDDGNFIILSHANGFSSYYKHASKVLKRTGQKVQKGDPIALVGDTGEHSSGPHLHFELWENNTALDPLEYLSFGN